MTASRAGETSKTVPTGTSFAGTGRRSGSIVANAGGKGQFVIGAKADETFAEPLCGLDELADGDGVEQLVGGQKQEAVRQRIETVVPGDLAMCGGSASRSARLRSRSLVSTRCTLCGLDKVPAPACATTRRMSAIMVPRPGPISTRIADSGAAMLLPGLDQEDADHFAEQLADFRRGDEIAGRGRRARGSGNSRARDRPGKERNSR